MRHIFLITHYSQKLWDNRDNWQIPKNELKILYNAAGVDLEITEGPVVAEPETLQSFRKIFCQLLNKPCSGIDAWPNNFEPNAPAHLIVASRVFFGGIAPLGAVVHPRRGGGAVFINGDGFYRNSDLSESQLKDRFFQVCAHEIGHILNLLHSDAQEDIATVMKQMKDRKGRIKDAWTISGKVWPGIASYPFSRTSRNFLETENDYTVLPWKSRFRDLHFVEELFDSDYIKPEVEFIPEDWAYQVGDCLPYAIGIRNDSDKTISVPRRVGPEFGNIRFVIHRPNGSEYIHRPKMLLCSEEHIELSPKEKTMCTGILSDGIGGALFPIPGKYKITVEAPGFINSRFSCEIIIGRDRRGRGFTNRFFRYIADGTPYSSKWFIRKANKIISEQGENSGPLPGFLALSRALEMSSAYRAKQLLKIALAPPSPKAVRHEAAVTYANLVRHDKEEFSSLYNNIVDSLSEDICDVFLYRTLTRLREEQVWQTT